jgi:hypothetical protein
MIRLFKSIITMILLLSFLLFTACTTPGIGNNAPYITSLTANPSTVSINQTTTLTCTATDPDGDTLTYIWNKDTTDDEEDEDDEDDEDEPPEDERILPSTFKAPGTISGSGKTVTWTAPSITGTYTATCTVSDGRGGEDSKTVKITVGLEIVDIVHNLTKGNYYNTIQAALDDADNDNTIEVADGTYYESIVFPSNKKIILKSINGSSSTIIRGNDGSPTVIFDSSLTGTTIEGFTISHKSTNSGRGIYITGSNLDINNCIISSNATSSFDEGLCGNGGGIYNDYSSTLTITESTISGNTTSSSDDFCNEGGGIYNEGSLTISGSTISGNTAFSSCDFGGSGGGISNFGSLTISGSTISGNTASSSARDGGNGGGISNFWRLTITESTISGNTTSSSEDSGGNGGGIYSNGDGSLTISGSTISGNNTSASQISTEQYYTEWYQVYGWGGHGGGIYYSSGYGPLTISGSTISGNTADVNGGGIYNDYESYLTISGSTISDNSAAYWGEGGGIYFNFETSTAFLIGGDSENEKNTICGNYLIGNNPHLNQQIRDCSYNLYEDYRNTNYISAYCE